MKLLTLNCHAWQEEDQLAKIRHLAEVIKEKAYDVIALQEVMQLVDDECAEKVKADNYAVILLNELKKIGVMDYHLLWDISHIGYDKYEEGSAILTRCEIIKEHSFIVSKNTDIKNYQTRRVIGLDLVYKGKTMTVYSCHLGWWQNKDEPFQLQADALLMQLDSSRLNVLMGDFNNDANQCDEGYAYLLNKGLHDTYQLAETKDEGITVSGKIDGWGQNQKDLRLDLILTTEPVAVKSSFVIFNGTNQEVVSDHYGVEVELKL